MRSRLRRFTLIELVVSIGLLVAIAAIVAMSGSTFYQGYQRSLRVTDRLKELMAIDDLKVAFERKPHATLIFLSAR